MYGFYEISRKPTKYLFFYYKNKGKRCNVLSLHAIFCKWRQLQLWRAGRNMQSIQRVLISNGGWRRVPVWSKFNLISEYDCSFQLKLHKLFSFTIWYLFDSLMFNQTPFRFCANRFLFRKCDIKIVVGFMVVLIPGLQSKDSLLQVAIFRKRQGEKRWYILLDSLIHRPWYTLFAVLAMLRAYLFAWNWVLRNSC